MRNLTKTIAAVSLLVPASAYSLGIGDIKLHSALNQTLEAEIALLVSEGENISDLRVRLAPPEKFDEAGIPWSYFLSKIKFVPVLRPDGSAMVKVSSQDILKEPFLDFLVEVTWDKGNLYREFTVLVDPPAAYTQPVVPVVKKAESAPVTIVEEKTVTRQSLENKILDGSRTTRTTRRDGKYGPIRRNESLWRIAERTNSYSDVSIEQMMMAIYQANQSAFDGNVNSLRAGQTLEIPEKEVILNLTKKQAKAAFIRQTEAWKGHPVVAKAKQHSSQVISRGKAQLDLKAPADDEISDTTVVVAENEKLVNRIAELEKEKSNGTLSEEGLALQARMAKLEQQLEMMQKMLVLKDEQITVLQQELDQVSNDLVIKEPIVDQGVEPESTKQPVEDVVKPDTSVTPTQLPVAEEVTKVEDKEPAVDKPQEKQVEPKSDWGFPMMSALAIPLLGGLGWLFWRRKKNNDEMDAESMFSAASGISMPEPETIDGISSEIAESSAFESAPTDESSLIGEFETSDFNSFYTEQSEVDPVLEADVYLAYGRHQQAEELMLQAIADQPDRDECKLKLLEVYQVDENKNAFEKYTTELLNAGKNNDEEFWDKVVEMGTKLNIEPGLLGEDVGKKANFDLSDADEGSTPAVDENSVSNSDALLSEHADVAVDDEVEAVVETANEMEFDLSIFDEDEKDLDLEIEGGSKDDNSLDFDLSQFDLDDSDANSSKNNDLELIASETEKKLEIDSEEKSDEIESFDFDIEAKATLDDESELSKFDFNNLSSSLAGENDSFNLATETSLDTKSNDLDVSISGLTDEDELETKIDLAKAYIDMEDTDSAKAIAEEVLEKGNEKQKQAAQDIIKQLDQA